MNDMKPKFRPGKNIAIKVPSNEFKTTVEFYQTILEFEQTAPEPSNESDSVVFKFGDKNLWVDKTPGISHAEIWLEVNTENVDAASSYLKEAGCIRRDDVEKLPEGFKGFWITNSANIIHLISE